MFQSFEGGTRLFAKEESVKPNMRRFSSPIREFETIKVITCVLGCLIYPYKYFTNILLEQLLRNLRQLRYFEEAIRSWICQPGQFHVHWSKVLNDASPGRHSSFNKSYRRSHQVRSRLIRTIMKTLLLFQISDWKALRDFESLGRRSGVFHPLNCHSCP